MKLRKAIVTLAAALLLAIYPAESGMLNLSVTSSAASSTVKRAADTSGDKRVIKNLNTETIIEYPTMKSSFTAASRVGRPVVYGFDTIRSSGIAPNGTEVPVEAEYGLTLSVNRQKSKTAIYIQAYNNTDKELEIRYGTLEGMDKNNDFSRRVTVSYKKRKLETSDYDIGLYKLTVSFRNGNDVSVYFYVNDTSTVPCIADKMLADDFKKCSARREGVWATLAAAGVTEKNSLSLKKMYYPNYPFDEDYRCDTEKWIDLSDELTEDDWTAEHKAFVIFDWVINNIAYDRYMADNFSYSRATTYEDWSGKYSIWDTRTGVCHDFANILVIMFRAQGIPATTIGSEKLNHVWTVACINGRWIELDGAMCSKYETEEEDTSIRTEYPNFNIYKYAFRPIPHNYDYPSDAKANDSLMYNVYYIC